jgi:two-component system, chemotaxis family, chemotaxis protein CheY
MTASPHILIVDDDRFARVTLRDCLAGLDCELSEAADGEEALALVRKRAPDLVLLDLMMPKMSGLQVLTELRAMMLPTKVLVISSLDTQSLVDQAVQAGADGFIAKPFHPIEIAGAVKQVLEGEL